jgi:hypothetical protein
MRNLNDLTLLGDPISKEKQKKIIAGGGGYEKFQCWNFYPTGSILGYVCAPSTSNGSSQCSLCYGTLVAIAASASCSTTNCTGN